MAQIENVKDSCWTCEHRWQTLTSADPLLLLQFGTWDLLHSASIRTPQTTVRTGEIHTHTHTKYFTMVTLPGYVTWLLLVLQEHSLDLAQLLGPGPYKEQYRADMIRWGETRRRQDPGFFCRLATRGARQPVWVCHHWLMLTQLLYLCFTFTSVFLSLSH